MGFSLTSPAPEKGDPTTKNWVWGFSGDAQQKTSQACFISERYQQDQPSIVGAFSKCAVFTPSAPMAIPQHPETIDVPDLRLRCQIFTSTRSLTSHCPKSSGRTCALPSARPPAGAAASGVPLPTTLLLAHPAYSLKRRTCRE